MTSCWIRKERFPWPVSESREEKKVPREVPVRVIIYCPAIAETRNVLSDVHTCFGLFIGMTRNVFIVEVACHLNTG